MGGIPKSRMAGNCYNKLDWENWMTGETYKPNYTSTFLDVQNVVLFDPDLLKGTRTGNIPLEHLFDIDLRDEEEPKDKE